ncbi:5-oxoprolinase subunit PxpB [Paenalcaligenes niemegkensis]|uniref:5-oxoprolinase subunit PxpB n=1 Tax=Paenalcaligenes niemegkensis TaxID=2895469 RepID=UPI001EE87956|nr:5-oxoprolinase subunit PxpB [Paenalcaligenes niemegkensis]MCQ9618017.1 5-oxoprolinase subunit PxpB [Paenalcaligenes niemegkensis]
MSVRKPVWTIHAAGDRSLVVVFHDDDPAEANRHASLLARDLQRDMPAGVHAIVPGMVSVALHYAPERVLEAAEAATDNAWVSPYKLLVEQLELRIVQPRHAQAVRPREVVIPVCYGGEYGPDLEEVAERCQMSPEEVIRLHTQYPVSVFMLGFSPGHSYIGRFSESLSVGRRSSPRTSVAPGSIGLANRQSVIYSMPLPAGWHLIGRTPLTLFDAKRSAPSLLLAGDQVRFVTIEAEEFLQIASEQGDRA